MWPWLTRPRLSPLALQVLATWVSFQVLSASSKPCLALHPCLPHTCCSAQTAPLHEEEASPEPQCSHSTQTLPSSHPPPFTVHPTAANCPTWSCTPAPPAAASVPAPGPGQKQFLPLSDAFSTTWGEVQGFKVLPVELAQVILRHQPAMISVLWLTPQGTEAVPGAIRGRAQR